jgi:2-haloacid dehalogenase
MSARCIARMGHHSAMTDDFDFGRFEALTFDCYGTLIDWEAGLSTALRAILDPRGVAPEHDPLLETYAGYEAEAERPPYRTYREVLAFAGRRVAAAYGVEPTAAEIDDFAGSVVDWPAFEDSPAALAALKTRFRLGVLTNCDDDLFAASNRRLGVEFDWVVTAQQARGYKPAISNFELLFERVGLPRARILHVAQSLYHDHVPAKALGLRSVWIDRRHDRSGAGATPPADASPDLTFPDMASFAAAATSRTLADR